MMQECKDGHPLYEPGCSSLALFSTLRVLRTVVSISQSRICELDDPLDSYITADNQVLVQPAHILLCLVDLVKTNLLISGVLAHTGQNPLAHLRCDEDPELYLHASWGACR